jgi:carboxyl-terminal processing protease
LLSKRALQPCRVDDTFSKGIYKDYIQALDPSKGFVQSDIDDFAKYELELDKSSIRFNFFQFDF